MPELPEVETVRRGLAPAMEGARLLKVEVRDRRLSGLFRVGKDAKPGVYYHERSKSTAHDHVVFHMSNGATVTFNDPRRFGSMKLAPRAKLDSEPLLRGLGPEPLGNEFDAAMLATACMAKKTALKAALSDQRVVAGLGNIYVCEALFRARLSPKRLAS